MRILLLLLFPTFLSAQINRAYGVIEIGSTFPSSSATGPKFAYRPVDSSFYRWVHTNVWVKVVEPSIVPDTLYLKQLSGTTALVDGDTIDISTYFLKSDTTSAFASYLKRPVGWGLSLLTGKYPFVDSSKVASRYYVSTSPTTIAANYIATSNGSNLVARNLFDNNTYAGVIGRPWKFGEYTTAGLPTGVNGYWLYNTDIGPGWYDGARWNYVPKADRSAFTSTYIPFTNTSGQFTQSVNLTYDLTRLTLGVDGGSIGARRMYLPESWIEYGPTLAKGRLLITQRWGGAVESPISIGAVNTDISTFNQGTITLGSRNITTDNQYNITVGNLNSISTGTGVILGKSNTVSSFSGTHLVFGNNNINSAYTNGQSASIIVGDGNNTNGFYGGGLFGSTLKYYANRQIAFGANSANLNFSISEVYFGFGVRNENNTVNSNNGHGPDISINPSQASNASDKNGGNLNMNAGRGTGAGSSGDFIIATATPISSGTTLQSLTNRWWVKGSTGMLGNTSSPNYLLDVTSTNAYGLPRGTVAQRPTIIASTTPLRFNTDSTALEYGESVGTWRQIATRAYARSLVAGLGTGTVTSVGLSLPSIFSVSGSPVTTSGTLSATFTGGNTGQFLRGDGSWSNKIVKEAGDSVIFNKPGIFGGNGAFIIYGDDGAGYQSYHERVDYGYTYNYVYTNGFNDESRSYLGSARGTRMSPTSLLKGDRIGGTYFHAYGNSQFNKTAVIRAEVDSIYTGDKPMAKIIFGVDKDNNAEVSSSWRFIIKNDRIVSVVDHVIGGNAGIGLSSSETVSIDARLHAKGAGTTTGKTMLLEDNTGADILTVTDNKTIQAHGYGTGTKEASDLSKTQSNYIAGFATDGTVLEMEDLHVATTGLITMDEYDNSALFTPNAIGEDASELFLTTSGTTGKVLQRKMRETSFTNSNASITDDMLELAQDVFVYANCLAIATDSTVIDLPTPSVDYIGQVVEVCGDGRNATPNYQVYVRGVGATLWHQGGGADPSAQTYLEVTNLSSNHNTVRFICAQPSGSTYYWILLKQ